MIPTITEPNLHQQYKLARTRAQDFSFVLDELARPDIVKKLVPNRDPDNVLKTDLVPMYGHSLGGGSIAVAMIAETRIAGGLNLDGSIVTGPVLTIGVENPYMFIRAATFEGAPRTEDETWTQIWPHLVTASEVRLKQSAHGTFLDMPLLAQMLGLDPVPPEVATSIGKLPGDRAMEIVVEYVHAFLQFVLNGKEAALLTGADKDFPELTFVRSKQM